MTSIISSWVFLRDSEQVAVLDFLKTITQPVASWSSALDSWIRRETSELRLRKRARSRGTAADKYAGQGLSAGWRRSICLLSSSAVAGGRRLQFEQKFSDVIETIQDTNEDELSQQIQAQAPSVYDLSLSFCWNSEITKTRDWQDRGTNFLTHILNLLFPTP